MNNDPKAVIAGVLSVSDDYINNCGAIFDYLMSLDIGQRPELFEYLCNIWGTIECRHEERMPEKEISQQELSELQHEYEPMVSGKLKNLIRRNVPEKDFYHELWSYIESDLAFPTRKSKIYAVFSIANDTQIPYFRLEGGLKMAQGDFRELQRELRHNRQRLIFILTRDFSQKTERAWHLLKELDTYEDEAHRTVLLTMIIEHFTRLLERSNKDD